MNAVCESQKKKHDNFVKDSIRLIEEEQKILFLKFSVWKSLSLFFLRGKQVDCVRLYVVFYIMLREFRHPHKIINFFHQQRLMKEKHEKLFKFHLSNGNSKEFRIFPFPFFLATLSSFLRLLNFFSKNVLDVLPSFLLQELFEKCKACLWMNFTFIASQKCCRTWLLLFQEKCIWVHKARIRCAQGTVHIRRLGGTESKI